MIIFADGFSEQKESLTVRIVGLAFFQGLASCLDDTVRRVKVGFTNLHMDDVDTLPLEDTGAFQDVHDNERGDVEGFIRDV